MFKEYQEVTAKPGTYECKCKAGFVEAGLGCITPADRTELENNIRGGNLLEAKSITYRSLIDSNEPKPISSDVFGSFFEQSAVGCWKNK